MAVPILTGTTKEYPAYRVRVYIEGKIIGAYVEETLHGAQVRYWQAIDTYRHMGAQFNVTVTGLIHRSNSVGDVLQSWYS